MMAISQRSHGYLSKEINAQVLCMRSSIVAAGRFLLDPTVHQRTSLTSCPFGKQPSHRHEQLSDFVRPGTSRTRPRQPNEKPTRAIAEQMAWLIQTVKNYLSNILRN